MLDRLLGRTRLQARIVELEEQLHHTERQLEAEQERRREAVADRQEADHRVNRLEDRIAGLEGRLEHSSASDRSGVRTPEGETLEGEALEAVLGRLESVESDPEGLLSAYVDAEVPATLREHLPESAARIEACAPCLVFLDDANVVGCAIAPPVPPEPFVRWSDRFRIDRAWFEPREPHAVALVRTDTFALGEYRGRERVAFDGFQSEVMNDHSKGGFSQARFERLRDEQVDAHLERCQKALRATDVPLYLTGDRVSLARLEDHAAVTAPVDATGAPEDALDRAVHSFWQSRLWAL